MARKAKSKLHLELPYPPSVNHYYGRSKTGQVYIKAKGKQFRTDVMLHIHSTIGGPRPLLSGHLAMSLLLYPPDKRERDIDNVLKALKDSMQHAGVYKRDSQIKEYREPFKWGPVVKGGKVAVELEEI